MDKFVIFGKKKLSGSVEIDGSKNAVLPVLAASLLLDKGTCVIENVPDLADVHTMVQVMEHLGTKVEKDLSKKRLSVDASGVNKTEAPYELVSKMRASFLVLGPLLGRFGKAKVSLPGGCVLGQRPVNLHLYGFSRMGAKFEEEAGYVIGEAKELSGATIFFDRPTHTGTENIITGAVLARGKTTIINAACDPEVVDLANFLNKMGAKIEGAGTAQITINGVKKLEPAEHRVIPDRLEAGTFLTAAAATGGYVELTGLCPTHLHMVLIKLAEMGVHLEINKNAIKAKGPTRLKAFNVVTFPYPGFPTDLQAQMMSLATVANGTSHLRETVFEDRFTHAPELARLGAKIEIAHDEAAITGVETLKGATIMASDIRAGAGLVVAALAAEGKSEILRVYHVDRGYHRIEEKLSHLGAEIKRARAD
ncbi:MAG: UDP-N-acetylglucosamine 1-carboxyvinyltransferase [Candidatus Zixiibacteriota bacterium]